MSEKSMEVLIEKNRKRPFSAGSAGPDPLRSIAINGIIPSRSRNTVLYYLHSEPTQIVGKLPGYRLRPELF